MSKFQIQISSPGQAHSLAAAACRSADPALFFPDGAKKSGEEQLRRARSLCFRCPVRLACLAHALEHDDTDGVWGGFTARERHKLRQHAARLRKVRDRDVLHVGAAESRPVPPRYRPAVVYRLLGLGWDSVRIAAALHVPIEVVVDARRTAERAVFFARAEELADRSPTAA